MRNKITTLEELDNYIESNYSEDYLINESEIVIALYKDEIKSIFKDFGARPNKNTKQFFYTHPLVRVRVVQIDSKWKTKEESLIDLGNSYHELQEAINQYQQEYWGFNNNVTYTLDPFNIENLKINVTKENKYNPNIEIQDGTTTIQDVLKAISNQMYQKTANNINMSTEYICEVDPYKDESKGIKENSNKLEYELSWEFIEMMAERMSMNKGKYDKWNWKKPINIQLLKEALTRHFVEVMKGNYNDEQTFGHLIALANNAMIIIEQLKLKDENN